MKSDSDDGNNRPKPISIRDAVGGKDVSARAGSSRPGESGKRGVDPPDPVRGGSGEPQVAPARPDLPRTFVDGEVEWTVRIAGMSLAGTSPDRGVALMHLTFSTDPEEAPEREALVAARGLDTLHDDELRAYLTSSREVPDVE